MKLGFLLIAGCFLPCHAAGQEEGGNLAPNGDFSAGDSSPEGWRVGQGQGTWQDRSFVVVQGTGSGAEYWQSRPLPFHSGGLYHFTARARLSDPSGSVIAGPSFANRDYRPAPGGWRELDHWFWAPVPEGGSGERVLRLGLWESKARGEFDDVRVIQALPLDLRQGPITLGAGESILGGRYRFRSDFSQPASNYHRTLVSASASFNSDRWNLGGQAHLTYRFEIPTRELKSLELSFRVGYHVRGGCMAQLSRDGRDWVNAGTLDGLGTARFKTPEGLLPAQVLWVRLKPKSEESAFQVHEIGVDCDLSEPIGDMIGQTALADLSGSIPGLFFEGGEQTRDPASGRRIIRLRVSSQRDVPLKLAVKANEVKPSQSVASQPGPDSVRVALSPGERRDLEIPLPSRPADSSPLLFTVQEETAPASVSVALHIKESELDRSDYGGRIAGASTPGGEVWWCEATRKVSRGRALPEATSPAVELSAAKNDWQAAQIVVRPAQGLENLTAVAGDLIGEGGARIAARDIQVLRVAYHFVEHPTDHTGTSEWWPDALPPLEGPLKLPAGVNQPLWYLVRVPEGASAGDYSGELKLEAGGWSAVVPVKLHVWDFALPEANHLQTALGFDHRLAFQYHNVTEEKDRRALLDLYLRCFSAHRISPYNPVPLDSMGVVFRDDTVPPRAELDFKAFDLALANASDRYHFNTLMVPLQGMGGGTFHSRVDPQIGKFREGTPEYELLFSSYAKGVADHLKELGWLESSYVYWFDEPEPKDYEFVKRGMERIKQNAPGLPRMLTEEPVEELAGAVDIWCPLTANFDAARAKQCYERGERLWWYICTGPRAPYCTLFIDHPATELRVWLWQTWQRDISGILVWATNWWTSPTAFPNTFQDPYEDPMSYTAGYGLPEGTRAYWGNGDGRFIYPPLDASQPGLNGGQPNLKPPVSSLRWEMLREGVEDYEFLWLLRDLLEKRRAALDDAKAQRFQSLLAVPELLTKDLTTFATDPAVLDQRRAEIAGAIEELLKLELKLKP